MDQSKHIDKINSFWEQYTPLAIEYGTNLIFAILVLVLGFWFSKLFSSSVKKMMLKSNLDKSLVPFLSSLLQTVLKVLVAITALGVLGIEMTSFIAILGAAGLAVGMALSGTLQNFAGGVMILIFKPFKVGDFISAHGHSGSVKEIQIFNTLLTTPDNKVIIIPNGGLSTGSMINYSGMTMRRVDWTFSISYGDDYQHAEQVLKGLIEADKRILTTPEPFIGINELASSSVNIALRVWVNIDDYWDVFFDMNKNVFLVFKQENLHFPFPQMDIHTKN
jgi:small conductance mechanosensitive channel